MNVFTSCGCTEADAWKSTPVRSQMILCGEEYSHQDLDRPFGVSSIGEPRGAFVFFGVGAAGEEHAGEVADGGYDGGYVVSAFPEAVIGCLVAEDLKRYSVQILLVV